MRMAGLIPLSVLGLVSNCVSFWVWHGDTSRSPVTFLFQYLAVWDNLFLASAIGATFSTLNYLIGAFAVALAQLVSVHTTLMIAVCRWMAVWRPLHVHRLLTRHRVIVTCAAVLLWCAVIAGVSVFRQYLSLPVLFQVLSSVGTVVPLLTLLGFSMSLLWMTHRRKR